MESHSCGMMIAAVKPQRTSVIENSVLSAAITTSQAEMMPVPPPKQPPCTSATVGIGRQFSRCTASKVARDTVSFSSGDFGRTELIHFRSAPAWKCLPLPFSTTTRSDGFLPSSSIAASTPWIRPASQALLTSGRLSVTVATPRASRSHKTGFDIDIPLTRPALFRGVQRGFTQRIVDDDRRLEEADLGRGAVAIGDHLAPFGVIDALRRLAAFPEVAAAAGAALGVEQIIFAHEALQPLIFRRRTLEEFLGLGGIDGGRQLETDDGGDHGWSSCHRRDATGCTPGNF